MPFTKYFGWKTREFGRPLWEILLNLKNFGKGRYVYRTTVQEKYPKQPSFYKIIGVHPHVIEYPETFQGNVFVEEVYRGVKRTEVVDIGDIAGKGGFQLILKEDEPDFLKRWEEYQKNPLPLTVLPRTAPFPPLWKEILAKERGVNPEHIGEMTLVHEVIEPGVGEPRRLAEEGEEPTFKLGPGNWKPLHPLFLKHVIKSREAAREQFMSKIPDPDFVYADKGLDEPVQELMKEKAKS